MKNMAILRNVPEIWVFSSSTATVWVREYKANGRKVVKEKQHGRKKGMEERYRDSKRKNCLE